MYWKLLEDKDTRNYKLEFEKKEIETKKHAMQKS